MFNELSSSSSSSSSMAMAEVAVDLPNQPPPPPARSISSSSCDRHPDEKFTGFCASCLRERLAGLEYISSTSTTHRNSTSTISSSIKSIFFRPQPPHHPPSSSSNSALHQPELRRCKSLSFSARGGGGGGGGSFEPQRKSCDVRGRSTLWSLFHKADNARTTATGGTHPLPSAEDDDDGDEIRPVDPVLVVETSGEIDNGGGAVGEEMEAELKPMKDHIDLESQSKRPPSKDFKEIAGSFWLAASVFNKKLQKWRRKQKLKKINKEERGKPRSMAYGSSTRFRDTHSEIAIDALGRRSYDTDPRFSLDAGRISFDEARYSLDEPRASWDGYLIGGGGGGGGVGRLMFPRLPPMLSVVEDDVPTPVVQRSDGQIPVEEDLAIPGCSAQTKDYYSDSSSRSRRRSLDRSSSVRKLSVEMSEQKLQAAANSRVSPAVNIDLFRDWSSNSLRSDRSESFESSYREDPHKLPPRSKSKRWSKAWSIWGFIHRRSSSRGANVVDRSFSESWPDVPTNGYGSGKILRSKSSVSSRGALYENAAFGSTRKNGVEMTNGIGKKRREEFVLERNRSARYSPGRVDNGMLRFYLPPMRSSSSRKGGLAKNLHNSSYQSFTRSVLRLY